jgi:hypothetical protein
MDFNELIKTSTYKSIATYLRHNPEKREDLLGLTKHIDGNSELKNNELVYLLKNHHTERPKCSCGDFLLYVKPTVGYKSTCGKKECINSLSVEKRIKTNNERYGGNSPANSTKVVEKIKNTIKERYGVDSINKIPGVKEKIIETNLNKYGTEWSSQSKTIKEKSKKNLLEKWGVDCTQKLPFVKEKTIKTNQSKWGFNCNLSSKEVRKNILKTFKEKYVGGHPSKDPLVREKTKLTNIENWGVDHPSKTKKIKDKIAKSNTKQWLNRIGLSDENFIKKDEDGYYVLFCDVEKKEYKIHPVTYNRRKRNGEVVSIYLNPLNKYYSNGERELLGFIKTLYDGEILTNNRSVLGNYELDIFIPTLNLAFEYNGMYFHSDNFKPKKYHQNKFLKAKEKDVRLIQVWEDEWFNEREKIESYIKHVLNKTERKIYARNCEVKFIGVDEYKNFCEKNHLQGYSRAKHKIGLYHNNILMSVMSFCTPRVKSKTYFEWEMIRFCNKLGYNVIGGGSKLFKFFVKHIKPTSIITYSDLDKFHSSFYSSIGFKFHGITEPSLFYYDGNERINRFKLRKEKIIEKGINIDKYHKIYGSGNSKWVYYC